jgi:hypothetical protein
MNPHVKELIDQATEIQEIVQPNSLYPSTVQKQIFDKELFAHLIVNECIDIISQVDTTDQAQSRIQEYFIGEYDGKTN